MTSLWRSSPEEEVELISSPRLVAAAKVTNDDNDTIISKLVRIRITITIIAIIAVILQIKSNNDAQKQTSITIPVPMTTINMIVAQQ